MNKRDPKGTPKNLMPPTKVHKLDGSEDLDGGENFKCNPKRGANKTLTGLNRKAYQIQLRNK